LKRSFLKEDLKRIKKELRLKQKEKEDILRKESSIRKSLDRVEKNLHKREKAIKERRAELDQIKRIIRDIESQILVLAREVKQTEDKLGSALQALYKMSQTAPEAYLFSLSSSADLLKMDKYLRVLVEHQAELTNKYKHELALRRSDEAELVENRIGGQQSISEEEKKKEKVRKLRNEEQAKLKSTVNQKAICQLRLKRQLERPFMPIGSKNLGIPSS
jgi:septal ring factor EnvC (AmiA/AmiB activator)